ncbi:MAG: DNA adenine methylase [Eubacterium sp.]
MISIPFSGSKRNRYKEVMEIVKENGYEKVCEPFGGSAVLSVNLINDKHIKEAIINDYDHIFDMYPEYLKIKENLIKKLLNRGFVKSEKRVSKEQYEILQKEIIDVEEKYLCLLASNFVFSAIRTGDVKRKDFTYFMNEITTNKQWDYYNIIKEIKRDTLDYKVFISKHKDTFDDTTLLIVDPPYINASQKAYKNKGFFGLSETFETLEMLKKLKTDFIFFGMVERDITTLLKLFGFEQFYVKSKRIYQSAGANRDDCMVYVKMK